MTNGSIASSIKDMSLTKGLEEALYSAIESSIRFDPRFFELPVADDKDVAVETYTIDASSQEEIYICMNGLEKQLAAHGMLEESAQQLVYAVMEAINNGVEHAYDRKPGKKIYVDAMYTPFWADITVRTYGKPLDKDVKRIVNDRGNLREGVRGRGFEIMRMFSNVFKVDSVGDYVGVRLLKFYNDIYAKPN